MKFSIIIPISKSKDVELNKYRNANILKSLDMWLNQDFMDKEIIVVDQVQDKDFGDYSHLDKDNIVYYQIYDEKFRRGWALNYGAVRSYGDILIFADADALVFEDYLSLLDYWVDPYEFSHGVMVMRIMSKNGQNNKLYYGPRGLINISYRDFFFDVLGGWNETFTYGSGTDLCLTQRAFSILQPGLMPRFPVVVDHLWHPPKHISDESHPMWDYIQSHPMIINEVIKELGVGRDKPTTYNWKELKCRS